MTNSGVAFLAKELGAPADVVPVTYKKKRAIVAAPKVEDEEEKPVAATEEGEALPSAGRGTRA